MTRFILSIVLMLFAFSASADETVLGTHGNERQLNGNHSVWAHGLSAWTGHVNEYTTGANGCMEIIGGNYMSDIDPCNYYFADFIFAKDTTLTSWEIETVVQLGATFSCVFRLIDGDSNVVSDSEISMQSNYATGHKITKTVNHFFDASDVSQRNLSVQVKNGTTCAAGSSCLCDSSGVSILRFFGVD
tara:strand:+ start:1736 stop:2299 length:564 start_codon:yes stop_codon:yes gene_type:complete